MLLVFGFVMEETTWFSKKFPVFPFLVIDLKINLKEIEITVKIL